MTGAPVIRLDRVVKRYGATVAVDGLSLDVREGEVFGLLGPNGSGKTTTILMIMGLTEPTSGEISVLGLDSHRSPLAIKRQVGYMPDSLGFYEAMTARQNLRYSGRLIGLSGDGLETAIDEALSGVVLAEAADKRVKAFSHGMRQRLGLAEILLKRPKIAVLDEPTSGLDPEAIHRFLDLVRGFRDRGTTVLLSSHLLDQVQSVCDRVALFHAGRIVAEGAVADLARRVLGETHAFHIEGAGDGVEQALGAISGVTTVTSPASETYRVEAKRDVRSEIVALFASPGRSLRSLSVVAPSLDDVYRRVFEEQRHVA